MPQRIPPLKISAFTATTALGTGKAAHVLAPTVTSRGIINMAAIAAAEAVKG